MPIIKKDPNPVNPQRATPTASANAPDAVSSLASPQALKNLPSDDQSFVTIRENNLLYVDKTEYIYKLVQSEGNFFLSRPRRFGKSCLLGTMEELFKGNRELFQGLWINSVSYDFKKYPVVRLSMTGASGTKDELKKNITNKLEAIARSLGLPLKESSPGVLIKRLVRTLNIDTGQRVVVLIDEYDAPILAHINDIPKAMENRQVLHDFYSALKTLADNGQLQFMFVTGVTKFVVGSVFSDFDNLNDLTLDPEFNGICGVTMEEFETYCADYLPVILEHQRVHGLRTRSKTLNSLRNKIMAQFGGYSWDGKARIINPYSLFQFLDCKEFADFWFNTGTPTFLVEFIKVQQPEFSQAENYFMTKNMLAEADVSRLELIPLLFQTGYLTIDHKISSQEFDLKCPNLEVDRALNVNLWEFF